MACNTWKTYNSAIKSFDKFRQIYKLPDIWPVQDIVRYILVTHLSHAKTSASTVGLSKADDTGIRKSFDPGFFLLKPSSILLTKKD
jgi:hypothetical protein